MIGSFGGLWNYLQLQSLVYSPALLRPDERGFYRDYRYLSVGLLVAMLAVLIVFW